MQAGKIILLFITFLFVSEGNAQSCNGNLGDPVYSINFSTGENPGPSLNNIPPPYQYTNQDCPAEGFYAIRNSTFFCSNNTWHVVPFDHTPNDFNGYFFIVNALPGPNDIYIETLRGLCAGTNFEVSAWVLNLMKPTACGGRAIDPKLVFTITDLSGNILVQYNTGNLPKTNPYSWQLNNFIFRTPATSGDVILKITSLSAGGCGNEFALDDISIRPCGASIVASFANTPALQMEVCGNDTKNLLLTASYSNTYQNPDLQWQVSSDQGLIWSDIPGATAINYLRTATSDGEYWYRITIAEATLSNLAACRFASKPLKVFILPLPFAQATNYVFGCYGSTISLLASGGTYYEWTGPNGFYSTDQGPKISNINFGNTGLYIVKVTTIIGCTSLDSTNLIIYPAPVATLTPVDASICDGDSVQVLAGGSLRYEWLPPKGLSNDTIPNPFAKPTENTTYTVRVYNEYTCYDTASVRIVVWKKPKAFAGPDKFVRKGRSVKLEAGVYGTDISYSWSPPNYLDNPLLVQPLAGPPSATIYNLTVISNKGCGSSTDSVKVEVIDKLFIPSAFTPNDDALNDEWDIVTIEDYPKAVVEVFNRYGQVVYRSFGNDYHPWNGKFNGLPAIAGVYVYVLNLNNGKPIIKGTLTLIR